MESMYTFVLRYDRFHGHPVPGTDDSARISHTFCIGSYNWFCTLIRSCLISSVWSHLFDLILYFLLRSSHLYALFINSHECFYTVVRALSEKPLWNYRSCGLFWFRSSFFVFLFWCERTSYLLLWILSSCILILYLWIFFCFAFQEWITNVVSHPADWEIVTEDHLPEQVRRSVK